MENYNLQDPKKLNKEFLIGNKNFLNDARGFLIERSGYETSDFKSDDDVYDAFMQHFRRQNVNEFTATRDLIYAQTQTDDNGRARMGRLMDTFDHMDGELGWKAAGDYLGGVFTAPSTYAGIFSFGAAKAGALAAQQGVKFGIRQAIKGGARGAIPALAIDAPVAAGTIAAQEQIRKDTGIKEEGEGIDFGKVGTGATISALTSGIIGGGIGARQAYTGFQSEKIVMNSLLKQKAKTEAAHAESLKVFNSKSLVGKKAKEIKNKLALKETIPEALEEGKKLKQKITKEQVKQTPVKNISATIDSQTLDNIAAAGAKIYDSIKPRVKEVLPDGTLVRYTKGSKEDLKERFSSRITRALLDHKSVVDKIEQGLDETLAKSDASIDIMSLESILQKHNVSLEQLGLIYAEEISEAGRKLGTQSKLKRSVLQKIKEGSVQYELLKEMNDIDGALQSLGGDFTAKARTKVQDEKIGLDVMGMAGRVIDQVAVKGRVGLMTIQAVTTARNTTNGYMRNYTYALDNLGSGLYNVIGGTIKRIPFLTSKQLKEEGRRSVRLGVAQLKTSAQAALLRDLVLGTTSVETAALEKLFRNPAFGKSEQAKELFKEMGDIGNLTGTEGGLTAIARNLNILNTYSDNMFKRAIFSRELNKLVQVAYNKNLKTILMEGNFQAIDDKLTAKAMEQALEFTYQAGKFHKKEGWFNKIFANGVIAFGQSKLGSLVIPFPRYLINQLRFSYEHAPLLGMVNIGGILNKSTTADRVGKQLGGITTLYAFMQMRANLGTEDTGAFEFYSPTGPEGDSRFKGAMRNVIGSTGGYFDLKATLGPYAFTAWFADFLYRMMPHQDATTHKFKIPKTEIEFDTFIKQNPRMAKGIKNNRIRRDLAYALTGGLGRAGTASDILDIGIDTLVNGTNLTTDRKAAEYFYKILANALNTYTVGAGVIKDTAAIISPNFRKVPNNTDVSILGYFAKQATRAFPQIADPTGVDSFKGIDNDVDGMNIFNTGFVYKGVGPDRKGFSATPYRSTGITYVNPLLKQATGLFEQEEKTFAQKEFDRLGFDYVELIPRRVQDDTELNNDQKQVMSTIIESTITNYIAYDTGYKKSSDIVKRRLLTTALASAKQMARQIVLDPKGAGNSYTEIRRKNKAVFYSLPQDLQKELQEMYKTQNNGEDLVDIEDFGRALAILEEMPSKRRKAFLSDPNYQDVLKGFKGFD